MLSIRRNYEHEKRGYLTTRNVLLVLAAVLAMSVSVGCAASQWTSVPMPTLAPTATPPPTATPVQTATPLATVSPFQSQIVSADEVPRITPQELKAALDEGGPVVIVDVRSREAFDEKHIEGAISVPLAEVEQRLAELPKSAEIVMYCT